MKKKLLFLILALATFLRFWDLTAVQMGNDQGKTALGIAFPHSFLLSDLSVWSQKLFGVNEYGAYLPFIIFALLGVVLAYFLGKQLVDDEFGLMMAFLLAIFPANILIGRQPYNDVAMLAAWTFTTIFFFRAEKSEKLSDKFWLYVGLMASPFFKVQGGLIYFIIGFFILLKEKGKFWKNDNFWILLISPWPYLIYLLSQPQQLYNLMTYTENETGGGFNLLYFILQRLNAYGFVIIAALIGAYLKFTTDSKEKKWESAYFIIIFIFSTLFMLWGPRQYYYLVFTDVSVAYFAAWALLKIGKRNKSYLVAVILLLLANSAVAGYYGNDNLDQYSCRNRGESCVWQTSTPKIISLITSLKAENNIYLDTDLGFTARWKLPYVTKKLESMPLDPKPEEKIVAIVRDKNFLNNKTKYINYQVIDYPYQLTVLYHN